MKSREYTEIVNKFRAGRENLNLDDESILRNIIISENNKNILAESIYFYSYSFPFNLEVSFFCNKYITNEIYPGLSSVCLKAFLRYWYKIDLEIIEQSRKFLEPSLWSEFYDEIFFLVSFFNGEDGEFYIHLVRQELENLLEFSHLEKIHELKALFVNKIFVLP